MSSQQQQTSFETYRGNPAENYERFFVPTIGYPLAVDLVDVAGLRPGERVLDVACGTGVVARLAAERVGAGGEVEGLDVNPSMLEVARTATPPGIEIAWHEASAEAMPLAEGTFDVVFCQMGLQFVADRPRALREMRRVLAPGGRLALNVPGPTPRLFEVFEASLRRFAGAEAGAFVDAVFSLHGADKLRELLRSTGFGSVEATSATVTLPLPAPEDFLWQYVNSTPLAAVVGRLDDAARAELEQEVVRGWRPFADDGTLGLEVDMTLVTARA
jgi:ubiquinone/menaquinone biosynthesis C-methylase UbiE